MGPGEKEEREEEQEFENSGQAFEADIDAVYGEASDPEEEPDE